MASGLALLLELLSKEGSSVVFSNAAVVHSVASLSALVAASAATSSVGILPLYAHYSYLRDYVGPVAHCEEFHDEDTDLDSTIATADGIYRKAHTANKPYTVSLKPIYSAFYPGALVLTISRALLVNFQPILEAYASHWKPEDEDQDEFEEEEEPLPIDYEAAFKGSGWTVFREVTVVTTRRLLERLAVRHVSKRTAWKLLKDLPTSSQRKAGRLLPMSELMVGVTKTTFRGHLLGIAATWLVQLLIDIYTCIRGLYRRRRKLSAGNTTGYHQIEKEELAFLLRKTVGNTLKCGASLALASVGAGLGVVLISPSWGQRLGCMAGEFAGAVGMSYLIDPWIIYGFVGSPDLD
eukprot:c32927_g1_i1 orf=117-1169(-)